MKNSKAENLNLKIKNKPIWKRRRREVRDSSLPSSPPKVSFFVSAIGFLHDLSEVEGIWKLKTRSRERGLVWVSEVWDVYWEWLRGVRRERERDSCERRKDASEMGREEDDEAIRCCCFCFFVFLFYLVQAKQTFKLLKKNQKNFNMFSIFFLCSVY